MSEENSEKKDFTSKIEKFLPAVEKPVLKQTLNKRFTWTGIALALYLLLTHITVFGISSTSELSQQLRFLELVLGSKIGSIMTLGIGPIVTAGILLQLLVGSKIINLDTKTPEGRRKFQTWDKALAIAFCFLEGFAYVIGGILPVPKSIAIQLAVTLQLALGGIIVILLDEIVQKWGFGSGVSLFIVAGVATQIMQNLFSPFYNPSAFSTGPFVGIIWNFFYFIFSSNTTSAIISILPLISTIIIFLIVVYIQSITISIPLTFTLLRGFGRNWALNLVYTSNIPVILVGALIANFQLLGRIGIDPATNCGLLGCFDSNNRPISGLVYYLSTPGNILIGFFQENFFTINEIIRIITYVLFFSIGSIIFAKFWVSTSGMDAKSVAEQIESIGMQIPGYRKHPQVIESVLNKYIPQLTVIGGFIVGFLAALADLTGALGTGTGILLSVMIIYNMYQQLERENLEEAHPLIRKFVGA
jgi:preprotein translocase subunit SecY